MTSELFFRTLLKSLALPPGLFVLLLLLALVTWRSAVSRILVLASAAGMYLLSTSFMASWLAEGLEIYQPVNPEALKTQQTQALVVLMAGRQTLAPEYGADTVGRYSMDRLAHAARLHRETGLPIVLSGGSHKKGEVSLAALGAETLINQFNIEPLARETESTSTWENAQHVAQLLRQHQLQKVAVVTHAWHMPRALYSFERAGVSAVAAPTYFIHKEFNPTWNDWIPNASSLQDSAHALHEYLGLLWYKNALDDT